MTASLTSAMTGRHSSGDSRDLPSWDDFRARHLGEVQHELARSAPRCCPRDHPIVSDRFIQLATRAIALALLVPPEVRGRQGRRESLREDAGRHRGGELSRCFEVPWFGRAQHAHRLGGALPAQRAGHLVNRADRSGRVVVAMHHQPEEQAPGRVHARVVDPVEEVLEGPAHVTDVGRSQQEDPGARQHVRGRGRQGRLKDHLDISQLGMPGSGDDRLEELADRDGGRVVDHQKPLTGHADTLARRDSTTDVVTTLQTGTAAAGRQVPWQLHYGHSRDVGQAHDGADTGAAAAGQTPPLATTDTEADDERGRGQRWAIPSSLSMVLSIAVGAVGAHVLTAASTAKAAKGNSWPYHFEADAPKKATPPRVPTGG